MGDQPIVGDVWQDKYRWGEEESLTDTLLRATGALLRGASEEVRQAVAAAASRREICPAGRILAGAGTDKRVTLINCFVSSDIQDSLRTEPDRPGLGIQDAISEAAYTQQMGGGIGMDYSTIRPRGAIVYRTQSVSSGILPFMREWDAMCQTIRSSGDRRGAMMGTLGIWHPDLREFVHAKRESGVLTNFNVSVLVPDDFMEALARDGTWDLHFPVPRADGRSIERQLPTASDQVTYVYETVRARELWDDIIGNTYDYAEPGIIFIDRVNQLNNLAYCEHIHCSNPCGEQMLPAGGDCCLGHTNLAVMVDRPFESDATFNFDRLGNAAGLMVRLLDSVLDQTQWPVEAQAEEGRLKRRIGLGYTGLASALQQLGVAYGSPNAVELTREISHRQAVAAYWASVELARERGPFPLFDAEQYCERPFIKKLSKGLQQAIRADGIRNGVLLSIAPTGTTSLVLGNVSSGIEPVFQHHYSRKMRDSEGELTREYEVYDYGYLKYCEYTGLDPMTAESHLPEYFVTSEDLTVRQHLEMQAAAQEWVDSSISKTINCPESMTLDEFKSVYDLAYELGLKSCTTYRPNPESGRGSILSSMGESTPAAGDVPPPHYKVPMQEVVEGRRYRVKWPQEDCTYYITITDYVDGAGVRRPFEIFINTKSARHDEWVKALTLMITAIFRRGGGIEFVVEELKQVYSATGGAWVGPQYVPSLVAAIAQKIEEHFRWLGLLGEGTPTAAVLDAPEQGAPQAAELLDYCNQCGMRALVYEEGCATCRACGHSDCG